MKYKVEDIGKLLNDLAEQMGWDCVYITANDDDLQDTGIMIGKKEWVESVLDGSSEGTVLSKDVTRQ